MKFDQFREYNVTIFIKTSIAESKVGKLVRDLFLFFEKILPGVKANGPFLSFRMVWLCSTWKYNKNKLHINFQTVDPGICYILII